MGFSNIAKIKHMFVVCYMYNYPCCINDISRNKLVRYFCGTSVTSNTSDTSNSSDSSKTSASELFQNFPKFLVYREHANVQQTFPSLHCLCCCICDTHIGVRYRSLFIIYFVCTIPLYTPF